MFSWKFTASITIQPLWVTGIKMYHDKKTALVNYTRRYTNEKVDSRFEVIEAPLVDYGSSGFLSSTIEVSHLQFRETKSDYNRNFLVAPNRQFIILLDGEVEITTSLGEVRTHKGGDILLAEDTTGKGHKTRNLTIARRKSIFIRLWVLK